MRNQTGQAKPSTETSDPILSVDAGAMRIGPAARMFYAEANPLGRISYQIENRQPRAICLGLAEAGSFNAVIDHITWIAFFRPPSTRLRAIGSLIPDRPLVFPLGERWGILFDGANEKRCADSPLDAMRREGLIHPHPDLRPWIGLKICMNVHCREFFSEECLHEILPGHVNTLELYFDVPSGEFREAILQVQNLKSNRPPRKRILFHFPFVWLSSPLLDTKGDHTGPTAPTTHQVRQERLESLRRVFQARRYQEHILAGESIYVKPLKPAPSAPVPPSESAHQNDTTNLSDREMIAAVKNETDDRRRWALIEKNLRLASPTRTYFLFSQFAELIAEKAAHWPDEEIIALLGFLPGSILAPAVALWPLQKTLALAEDNPEKDYMLQSIREHEVERLFARNCAAAVSDDSEAKEWLNINESATPDEIRRIWRRLLGFLNGDFGRQSERALHRKKDEIAKRLQQARDLLLKQQH